ncbi:type II toxin-antitoxin system HicA family toxin [Nocardia higoensis]|uniref:Type II toxin-antitoxin system HicA family toxin n=1 Tax=Nocardia higoensis TaxID=228599 RepID=A0ABS0DIK6_9NOCA|nr:type II toxin-antitoxin system HicA family toxin [Nocardia higoensis]MBF6358296.1 type II toxin-antitoxin system HicA family toxin [Nocardia higoensis]
MLQILKKELGYRAVPHSGPGSHTWLEAEGRPRIRWAFHNGVEIPAVIVRDILVKQAGLTVEEAKEVLGVD